MRIKTLALIFVCSLAGAVTINDGLVGYWPFEEGKGKVSSDLGPGKADAILVHTGWAEGPFGRAVKINPVNSKVVIPNIPSLNGSKKMTLSIWAYWEEFNGHYPNIVFAGWNPGGLLFFVKDDKISFRLGRPGHSTRTPGNEWQELNLGYATINTRKWTHLAVVLDTPVFSAYIDGKLFAKGNWHYGLGFTEPIILGQWNTGKCHNGLVDELRLYDRALSAEEIALLADAKGRGPDSKFIITHEEKAETVMKLETRYALMEIDNEGVMTSLIQKKQGDVPERNLMAEPVSAVSILMENGTWVDCDSAKWENGLLTVSFAGLAGTASIAVEAKGEYFKFTVKEITVPGAAGISFAKVRPSCTKYYSSFAGLASDDESGVCIRALNLETTVQVGAVTSAFADKKLGMTGRSAGMAAGARRDLRTMLKVMGEREGMPMSKHGGPWVSESEMARLSYLFVLDAFTDVESWVDLARRGGFGILHFREAWFTAFGDYRPNPVNFPGGLPQLIETADKIHGSGLKLGLHTLTGCLGVKSRYITPEAPEDLIPLATYTLAKDFKAGDTVMYVNECPIDSHKLVFTYHGASNAFRLGKEIIRYSEISREKPYAFLKCERGAFGTKPADYAAGSRADYLKQVYLSFYPVVGSKLMESLSDDIGNVFKATKADFIYFDGSEGMGMGFPDAYMRSKAFKKMPPVAVEASNHGHHNWWFHSRLGAWDSAYYAFRQFHDNHVQVARGYRMKDLLEPQMGWWDLTRAASRFRRQFLEETEYFAAKNFALDASVSLNGPRVSTRTFHDVMDMMTVMGWYEQRRLANYYDKETRERVGEPGKDFRLRLDGNGEWKFMPSIITPHKLSLSQPDSLNWTIESASEAQPFRARIEGLYFTAPQKKEPHVIVDLGDEKKITRRLCATGVTQEVSTETADVRGAAANLRIKVKNTTNMEVGAWSCAAADYPFPYFNLGNVNGFGLWVKGDGSGAVLNVQFANPGEFGGAIEEHYIDLDFTGWRFCELPQREPDSERAFSLKWPYVRGAAYNICHNLLKNATISRVSFWLNKLPAQGSVDVTLGPIVAVAVQRGVMSAPVLTVNGKRLVLPVSIASGAVVEIEGDERGVLVNEQGNVTEHFNVSWPDGKPMLVKGSNRLSFSAVSGGASIARASVSVIELGEAFGKRGDNIDWSKLKYEYELPKHISRFDGEDNAWSIMTRDEKGAGPGDNARLEVTIQAEGLGFGDDGYSGPNAVVLEDFGKAGELLPSEWNDSAKYATDGKNLGAAAGVTRGAEKVTSPYSEDGAIRFNAVSSRGDNRGWAALGKRFRQPMDLRGVSSLGLWVNGDACGASLKIQLWDGAGEHLDFVTQIYFAGWKFLEFPVNPGKFDFSKLTYVMFYYNDLPANGEVVCELDNFRAVKGKSPSLKGILSINGESVKLPAPLTNGQEMRLRGEEWFVRDKGKVLASGKLNKVLPALRKGANALSLSSDLDSDALVSVRVLCTKVYGH